MININSLLLLPSVINNNTKYSKTLNCNKLFFCKFTEECILDCTPKDRSELYFYDKINAKISNKYEIDNLCHEDIHTIIYVIVIYHLIKLKKINMIKN